MENYLMPRPWFLSLWRSGAKGTDQRRQFIMQALTQMGVDYELKDLKVGSEDGVYTWSLSTREMRNQNIVAYPNGFDPNKRTKIWLAHYDVVCQHSDNANDNSASCCLLLEFCAQVQPSD